jgi:hypothetical protein
MDQNEAKKHQVVTLVTWWSRGGHVQKASFPRENGGWSRGHAFFDKFDDKVEK